MDLQPMDKFPLTSLVHLGTLLYICQVVTKRA